MYKAFLFLLMFWSFPMDWKNFTKNGKTQSAAITVIPLEKTENSKGFKQSNKIIKSNRNSIKLNHEIVFQLIEFFDWSFLIVFSLIHHQLGVDQILSCDAFSHWKERQKKARIPIWFINLVHTRESKESLDGIPVLFYFLR